MNINIGTYTATVNDYGVLKLHQAKERHLQKVTFTSQGTTVEQVPYAALGNAFAATPVVAATYAGDRYANVDLDAGWQRWNGLKSLLWLRKGLCKAGFDKQQVNDLLREMKKEGPHTSCPRQ